MPNPNAKVDTKALFALWADKEKRLGRRITLREIVRETGLTAETVSGLRDGKLSRVSLESLAQLCAFFDVPDGEAIPFTIYRSGNKPAKK